MRFMLMPFVVAILGQAKAQEPSYSKHIQPFLTKYCVECHPAMDPDGGLSLDTYKSLMAGGDHGKVIVASKPDNSRMVRMMEGKSGPRMPPKKAKQPAKEEIALVRAWVAAGAKDDVGGGRVLLPALPAKHGQAPAVAALVYEGDKQLWAGRQRELVSLNVAKAEVNKSDLAPLAGRITALAWNAAAGRLAIASGGGGSAATIRLISPGNAPTAPAILEGHGEAIYALAFSSDGKLLASTGYDRVIKLWDVGTGMLVRDLKDHADAVYGLCFSPDGTLLASTAADRAVKVWDVVSGKRLYTLSESTDWVYAVAWRPDGKQLAAAGVDRSIRVWEVNREGGAVVHSVFAHEGPVTRLVYTKDGQTLFSLGDDKRIKVWEAGRMVERKVIELGGDVPLALALRPDGKQLAVGTFDGSLVLLDAATGKVQAQPLPVKPKPPVMKQVQPMSGRRGQAIDLTVTAEGTGPFQLVVEYPQVKVQALPVAAAAPGTLAFRVTFPETTPAGKYSLRLKNEAGESPPFSFTVDLFAETRESEPNDSAGTGQKLLLPATVVGSLSRAGEVDYYRFDAKTGQEIGVQLITSAGTLEPVLELVDAEGQIVAESTDGVLGYRCPRDAAYALGVRDREFRSGATYRLHIGDVPVVTAVFPPGVQRGKEAEVTLVGVHLGKTQTVRVKVSPDAAVGSRVAVPVPTPLGAALGNPSVVVGEFPDVLPVAGQLSLDATGNGRIEASGQTQSWKLKVKKGERILLDVEARRHGSPLDSTLEVLDSQGKPLPRAVLRAQARTYSTFRDHDSFGSGIRIETWTELAVNDYIYLNSELLRIRALPKNPDDDCQFFAEGGRRQGFLGTTPGQLSLGTPMYKVTLHPPRTTFPPNGLPLVMVFWRNDDGDAAWGKDSFLAFDPPADGEYVIRVGDARGLGGATFTYRLTARRPRPDFAVSFSPASPMVWQGGGIPLTVNATRKDGFDGEIALTLENLPKGFHAPASNVLAEENNTVVALTTTADAVPGTAPLKLIARAKIDGKEVVREFVGGKPTLQTGGEILTTTEQNEVTIKPGGQTRLLVRIERKNFTGRVPLEIRGLPHGVRVLDIGLNGILINPTETNRTIVIQCDPWVQPTEHPFVVLAKREGKNTEHAAPSVRLKVIR